MLLRIFFLSIVGVFVIVAIGGAFEHHIDGESVLEVSLFAIGVAVCMAMARAVRGGAPATILIALSATSFMVLVVGAVLLSRQLTFPSPPEKGDEVVPVVSTGVLLPLAEGHAVVAEDQQGPLLTNVVTALSPPPGAAGFTFYPSLSLDLDQMTLVTAEGRVVEGFYPVTRANSPLYGLAPIVSDIHSVADRIQTSWRTLNGVVTLISLAFAVALVWFPLRMSRWCLFNILSAVFYLRGVVAIPRGATSFMMLEGSSLLPPGVVTFLPELGWILMVVVALLGLLPLENLNQWRREMGFRAEES